MPTRHPPRKGLLPDAGEVWAPVVEDVASEPLIAAVAKTVRALLLPEYAARRPADRRPLRAVEAAERWLLERTADATAHAAAVAKACSLARRETLGYEHRVAEAARALATAVTRSSDEALRAALYESLASTEAHLHARAIADFRHADAAGARALVVRTVLDAASDQAPR